MTKAATPKKGRRRGGTTKFACAGALVACDVTGPALYPTVPTVVLEAVFPTVVVVVLVPAGVSGAAGVNTSTLNVLDKFDEPGLAAVPDLNATLGLVEFCDGIACAGTMHDVLHIGKAAAPPSSG